MYLSYIQLFQVNSKVNSLNLQGNDIGTVGISYLQKMINETYTIAELVRIEPPRGKTNNVVSISSDTNKAL